MKVSLYKYTECPEEMLSEILSIVRHSKANISDISSIMENHHFSPLEFVNFIFLIEDIPRSLSHQLVRTRCASYLQESQRYNDGSNFTYYTPKTFLENEKALDIYNESMNTIKEAYSKFKDMGMELEDCREILPNATHTRLFMGINLRALMVFCMERMCSKSQQPIRELAYEMRRLVIDKAPIFHKILVPKCKIFDKCFEEKPCGTNTSTKGLSEQDEIDICNDYKTMQSNILCTKYGVCRSAIYKILKKYGIKRKNNKESIRRYPVNDNYFDIINSEEKAYFLGMLYADGNLSSRGNVISLELQEEDGYIVKKLLNLLQPGNLPKINNKINRKNTYSMHVHSDKLYNSLIKHGILPNKTFSMVFPTNLCIPNELYHHFIRGFFDGDGCISFPKNTIKWKYNQAIGFSANVEFLNGLRDKLVSMVGMPFHKVYIDGSIGKLSWGGRSNVARIFDCMYSGATIFLDRKFNKFKEALSTSNYKKNKYAHKGGYYESKLLPNL